MKKYVLLKNIITKDGNMLFARTTPYMEGEIPKEFINPLNVRVVEDDTQAVVYIQTSMDSAVNHLNPPDNTTNLTPKFYDSEKLTIVQKLDINSLTLDQLKELKGIGEKTAVQLVSSRPYKDLAELSIKVKPPTGKTWEDFNFMFSQPPTISEILSV
jgi:hypothetical protein